MKFFFCKGTQMFDWVGRQYSCTLVPVQGKFILATWKAWHGMRTTRRHEQWETCGIQDSWAWFAPRFFFAGWQELRFVSFREIKVSWTILVQTISFVDQSRSWAAYGTRQRILFVGVLSIRFITDKCVVTTLYSNFDENVYVAVFTHLCSSESVWWWMWGTVFAWSNVITPSPSIPAPLLCQFVIAYKYQDTFE